MPLAYIVWVEGGGPVDPGYGQGRPMPPHVGGGPIHGGGPVDPGYGHPGGGGMPPGFWMDHGPGLGLPPGWWVGHQPPPHVGGGPVYGSPVDPGYGQGRPLPPHVGGGPVNRQTGQVTPPIYFPDPPDLPAKPNVPEGSKLVLVWENGQWKWVVLPPDASTKPPAEGGEKPQPKR